MASGRDSGSTAPRLAAPGPGAPGGKTALLDLLDEETVLFVLRFGMRLTAGKLGLSERTFRRRFERQGLRLSDLLGEWRRETAVRLLASDLPVRTVAHRLGFSSSQTLARFLRREFGMTARGIRRRASGSEPGAEG